jgi:flagellar M-ring protein FliF
MGYNKDRGDELTVVNSPFAIAPTQESVAVPLWQNPEAIEYVKDALRFLVGVVVLFMMYKKVVKPLLTRLTTVPAPPQLNSPESSDGATTMVNEDGSVVSLSGGVDENGNPVLSNWEQNEMSGTNLAKARQLAQENPRMVASVVSEWTTNG